jgi:uncharacterized protein (DUF58 family)
MNSRTITLILAVFALFLAALFFRNGDLIWMALPLLAALGLGIFRSPQMEKIKLQATRSVAKTTAGGISTLSVCVAVRNLGPETVSVQLTDPLRPGMSAVQGGMRTTAALAAGGETRLQYAFQAGRGSFSWATVRAVVGDPLGLIETALDLPAVAEVAVQPELRKIRPFPLRPSRTLHTAGSNPARLAGRGTNFWGVREYHPGDPLRRIDWRRTARHPNQFFTKEFEQEEIADIGLILDARQMTDLRIGGENLFEHSVRAAASLAEVFLRQGNRVSLLIFGRHISSLFPGYGKIQLNRILHALSKAAPEADPCFNSLQFTPLNMFSSGSLILILSPLAPEDWRLFPRLRAHGYQALLISPDPIEYARRVLPDDPTTALAVRFTQVERRLQIGKITQLWIPVVEWRVDQPLAPLVRMALRASHIQQER